MIHSTVSTNHGVQRKFLALYEALFQNKITPKEALQELKFLPFEDLGFAKADTHRAYRTGFPEIILCNGKTPKQVLSIGEKIYEAHGFVVASRATPAHAALLKKKFKKITFHEEARILIAGKIPDQTLKSGIAVLTAGTSDIPVAEEAVITAQLLGHKAKRIYDVGIAGVHRLLSHRKILEKSNIVIVAAGMDGALPSLVAGLFGKPVIALPTSVGYGSHLNGFSALLTMLNSCALGIAVVNIDNGLGAGYLASLLNNLKRP